LRAIVRVAAHQYNRQRVSVQPSVSHVEEANRAKASSPSGRLLLRMPPGLHGELARAAERDGASLNSYIIARLTESVGWTANEDARPEAQGVSQRTTVTWLLAANVVAVTLASVAALVILLVAWLA
jgi:HicB family